MFVVLLAPAYAEPFKVAVVSVTELAASVSESSVDVKTINELIVTLIIADALWFTVSVTR